MGKFSGVLFLSSLAIAALPGARAEQWPNPNRSTALDRILDVQKTLTRCIIVPRPQEITLTGRDISLMPENGEQVAVVCDGLPQGALSPAAVLAYACERLSGGAVVLEQAPADTNARRTIVLTLCDSAPETCPQGAYQILNEPVADGRTMVTVRAPEPVGLLYGAYTLIQLVHVKDGQLLLREAQVADWPAIALRGPRSVGHSPDVVDWMSFYKMNYASAGFGWEQPIPADFKDANEYCRARGVVMVPETHAGNVHFCDPTHHEDIKNRIRELIDMGFSAAFIAVDDWPDELKEGDDLARYGKGLVGVGKAQTELMREVWPVAEGKIDLFFCPRVYYDPRQKDVKRTETSPGEAEYRRLVGELPQGIRIWTTQPKDDYLQILDGVWHRKLEIYHNFYYSSLADWKLWFEAYPVPSQYMLDHVRSVVAAGSGGPWAREWLVNYLAFDGNVWSPKHPVGLKEAFIREYGEKAAPVLTRYAELIGGHAVPGHTLMADLWDDPGTHAGLISSLGFAGRLWRREATPENVADLDRLALRACEVEKLDWAGTGLDTATTDRFRLNAERIRLSFEVEAALLQAQVARAKLDEAANTGADTGDLARKTRLRLEGARAQGLRIIDIIALQVPADLRADCHDSELADKVAEALKAWP